MVTDFRLGLTKRQSLVERNVRSRSTCKTLHAGHLKDLSKWRDFFDPAGGRYYGGVLEK